MAYNKKNNFYVLFIPLLLLITLACQAPRNNPLDPDNPNNQLAVLQGNIQTAYLPYQPISGVDIHWKNSNQLTQSDQYGNFSLPNIKSKSGWLYLSKSGFHSDSFFVTWDTEKSKKIDLYLNTEPVLDSLLFVSSILNRYPNIQVVELEIRARISDPDNDLDSVFLTNDELGFMTTLNYNPVDKFYKRKKITMANLGISTAEALVGTEFLLSAKDKYKRNINIDAAYIYRVIREEVDLKSPTGGDTVTTMPTLRWEPVSPGYAFQYIIEIRTDEPDPQLVWESNNLPSNSYFVDVDIELDSEPLRSYIWAVWIIDNFGNKARSKYKTFNVE